VVRAAAIVSAYFAEPYLEGRLENLLTQTERPRIVVVALQNSPEQAIAARMLEASKDSLLMTDKTPTVYHAWNLGVRAARTEFVTNANSDDRLRPDGIAVLVKALDDHPEAALVYPDVDIVQSLDGGFENAKRTGAFRFAEGGFKELMQMCFVGPMPMWRTTLHEKHGWFDAKMQSAGDYEFWLRLAKAGEKLLHVREVLGIYLDRPDSAEHRSPHIGAQETIEARKRYAEKPKTVYAKIGP
jgi:cellulose synthase/poly-beta-1,6-N-acetylglucosamine synthase-like glycosyltransferase